MQEERHPAPAPGPSTRPEEGSSSSAGVASVPQHRRQVGNIRYRPATLSYFLPDPCRPRYCDDMIRISDHHSLVLRSPGVLQPGGGGEGGEVSGASVGGEDQDQPHHLLPRTCQGRPALHSCSFC